MTVAANATDDNLRGALFMTLSMMGYTLNDAFLKVASADLPLLQIIFLRGLMATAIVLALAWRAGALTYRPARRDGRLILGRAVAELGGAVCFLTAVFNMPIANANAILQSVPLAVTLGAAFFLGERVGPNRYAATIMGFLGVLVIVRPGSEGFTVFSLWAVAAVLFITLRDLFTRRLSFEAPGMAVIAVTSVLVTVSAGLGSIFQGWAPVAPMHAALLAGAASFLIVGYLFSVSSMRIGEIGFVQPFRYTLMIWAILVGLLVFDEWPDLWTIIGVGIVIATGLYTLQRERRVARA